MYRWLQDTIWDSVMDNYEGYSQSEVCHSVYKGIPFWKKIIFKLFFSRDIMEDVVALISSFVVYSLKNCGHLELIKTADIICNFQYLL